MHRFFIIILICLLNLPLAQAYVVGEAGQTYEIKERDFTEFIRAKAAAIDPNKLRQEFQEQIKKKLPEFRLPNAVAGLPPATEEKLYKVDMTYTLPYNIKDFEGNVIYPKGYTFNPLKVMADKGIFYTNILVIINGEREEEVKWFIKNFQNSLNVKLLITDGHAVELAKKIKKPVYYLTRILRDKFLIEATPSVVFQPKGDVYMVVKTFVVGDEGEK